jgi:hypothetical protein
MRLFKYVESKRVDILENEHIAFTTPDKFKDPFEFRPRITLYNRNDLKQRIREEASPEFWQSSEVPKGLSRSERRKAESRIKKEVRRQIRSGEAHYAENFQDLHPTEVGNRFGILCLSAINTENLMWYHYADGHKGFVIEIDSEHPEF